MNNKKVDILIINLNKKENTLHKLEYIDPITHIIKSQNKTYETINYLDIKHKITQKYTHIILSGTGLLESEYLNHIDKFEFIKKEENINVLGICAGCQVIQKLFKSEQINSKEIGLLKPKIIIQDKILENESLKEIYTLHSTSFQIPKKFQIIAKTQIPQIIKFKNIYGTLFHPEVRNHNIIINFIKFK